MKYIILTFLISFNTYAFEYKSKIVCKNSDCYREDSFKNIESELNLGNLTKGQCLIDIKNEKFFKILDIDSKSSKIVLLTQIDSDILQRDVLFYNIKLVNQNLKSMKNFPCDQIPNILGNSIRLNNCLKNQSLHKYFCEPERLR